MCIRLVDTKWTSSHASCRQGSAHSSMCQSRRSATCEHETRALLEAARQYPRASLHLISLDVPAVFDVPSHVTVHAAGDWLLQENGQG